MGNNNHVEQISEIMARYPDEWIFFEVVEEDEYERPVKGRLIAHHPDREQLHRLIIARQKRGGHYGSRYAGRIVPEGEYVLL
ncbi:MAG TPA: hypothetical protein ENJ31_12080 [Anaerolineae bacterium]|nr:hypothetical protein [Anaerolineae bacterium]